MKKTFSILIFVLLASVSIQAIIPIVVDKLFPVLEKNDNRLFYLQRTPNTNTIVYDLNFDKSGKLNEDNPVHVYWIRFQDDSSHKELNYIQRKFAYGVTTEKIGEDKYELYFVAYKKLPITIQKSETTGKYVALGSIGGGPQMQIDRIFVEIQGGSFWVPNVMYVDIEGLDPVSGAVVTERINL